jgi:hypothetical protein
MCVTCPRCNQRLSVVRRLGAEVDALWQVGNRDGVWRGCAAFHSANGRVTLCVARRVEQTWKELIELAGALTSIARTP